ncbi:hypothetical protein [Lactobacillus nasalidis]|uniref:hypothetical protein n=1 Tax=Lactobacillus nasalidis TaxID=2797258 RepID=UPI00191680B6|nr:hypothetical protein [Lactobacillus nasalidis]
MAVFFFFSAGRRLEKQKNFKKLFMQTSRKKSKIRTNFKRRADLPKLKELFKKAKAKQLLQHRRAFGTKDN